MASALGVYVPFSPSARITDSTFVSPTGEQAAQEPDLAGDQRRRPEARRVEAEGRGPQVGHRREREALVVGQADDQAVGGRLPRSAGLSEPSRVAASKATGSIDAADAHGAGRPAVGDRRQAVRRPLAFAASSMNARPVDRPGSGRRTSARRGSAWRSSRVDPDRVRQDHPDLGRADSGQGLEAGGQVVGAQGDEVRAVVDRQDGLDVGLACPAWRRPPRPARGTRRPARRRRRRSRARPGPGSGPARARGPGEARRTSAGSAGRRAAG